MCESFFKVQRGPGYLQAFVQADSWVINLVSGFRMPSGYTTYNPKNQKHPMHMHDNYEIYSFLSGDAEYYVEGSRYPLKSGDIILIPPIRRARS